MNDYYVYEHIRLDNDTCFYIGKGRGKRYKCKSRNEHHDRIVRKYGMKAIIVKDGLTEDEAYEFEMQLIRKYVFEYGYGIDIPGYKKSGNKYLTNSSWGGKGPKGKPHTEEWKKQHSKAMSGENNPMYGINVWDSFSEDKKERMRKEFSQRASGKNNPMYGVSPEERMDAETYKSWHDKIVSRGKSLIGENNPNYNNHTLHEKVKDNPELRIKYYSRPGSSNGRARKVSAYKDGKFLETFDYMTLCAKWLKEILHSESNLLYLITKISNCAKKNVTYKGFSFKFEE